MRDGEVNPVPGVDDPQKDEDEHVKRVREKILGKP